ncbi:hypothetical protein [Streptomyces gardneri]|uniref:Secreted protein n=1 Tax=Streptomyces gardneri TaxID=66892 RepID=A0A4Y3RS24_9ACTN|nr:hypothetical protein [Streptomyces gardneri]GEB60114.1 hypothetical protein SGA01_57190 [Streptomyces gardneri]GHH21327.1 hypothetical protein GCM10017674_75970 [Streptomyces gardneri]
MKSLKKTAFAALATAAITILAITPATAGTSGQQAKYIDGRGDVYSVYIYGQNQNDEWLGHCFQTPHRENNLDGWWWWGNVRVTPYFSSDCSGANLGTHSSWFPWNQGSDNYVQIGL